MDIAELIAVKEQYEDRIGEKVRAFLRALHKAGGFAPTVSSGHGHDSIVEVTAANGTVTIYYENTCFGNTDYYQLTFPAALVNDPNEPALRKFLAEKKEAEEKLKQSLASDQQREQERQERETLARLKAKYEATP